jgi:Carboxypeptidase regulatory-like domain
VPGVRVELTKDGSTLRTTTTGADGQFSLDIVDLAKGTFDVRLTVPGFAVQAVRLSAGTARSTVQFAGFTAEVRASSLATAAPGSPPPPVLRQNRRGAVAGHYRDVSAVDRPDDRDGWQA